ncbi:hypothetical protein Pla100_20840 [Neorhodopirellula pilleata]|uniref:Uncharacterized protein n=1 Tax=Neorhodopirellula pilleata TaxID=2714738 RepID=A0A5C6AI45_9BACT|nr:hypothetical protein Pla100_20840 [Neorhodopirellula pilleata]
MITYPLTRRREGHLATLLTAVLIAFFGAALASADEPSSLTFIVRAPTKPCLRSSTFTAAVGCTAINHRRAGWLVVWLVVVT